MSGMYFEEFTVGQEFVSPGRTITESDVGLFAGLSGDYNPLHTDAEFGRKSIYGQRIVHGLLGLSIASGLMMRLGVFDGTLLAILEVRWRFVHPIFFGDTVHFVMRIKEKRETSKPDRGVVIREVKLLNQHDEVVQEGDMVMMLRRRPQQPPGN